MKRKRKVRYDRIGLVTAVPIIVAATALIISSQSVAKQSSTTAANESALSNINYLTQVGITAAIENYTTATVPYYKLVVEDYIKEYPTYIQDEIFNQVQNWNGELPSYEMILALWIVESNLNPSAINVNNDGTVDYGLSQLNEITLEDLQNKGWYNPEVDNLNEVPVQVRLGLRVLSNLCDELPGGEWDYYRAIRAYRIGPTGLRNAEAEGNFGADDIWYDGGDGQWYPGYYGKVRSTMGDFEQVGSLD